MRFGRRERFAPSAQHIAIVAFLLIDRFGTKLEWL
jgi:hypothetical protein